MSTVEKTTAELGAIADQAKAEVERLREEINAGPGKLAEIERRLNSATSEETMRLLIQQRARLREEREINVAALRGAEIRQLRAESAHVRALAADAAPDLPAAVEADNDAKANLEAAEQAAKAAAKRRARIEKTVSDLTTRWQKLSTQADVLEGLKRGN